MKLVALFFLALVAIAASDPALTDFAAGNLKFTARLYKEVLKANPNTNFIFSPLSIEVILALTRAGAKGQTASEFTTALNLNPNEQVTEHAIKQLMSNLQKSEDDLKLLSANRLFLGEKFQVLDDFKKLATGTFHAGTENVDFAKNTEAANIINQWVEQQTNNKIKDLIDPSSINALTRLVLVNALYFSGKWVTPFEPYTTKQKFYVTKTQTKEVDMMYIEDSFKYTETSNAQILELPYLGANISMTVVLPKEKEGLSAIENNLEAVLKPAQELEFTRVAVKMPTWLTETNLELKPILQNLGLQTVFTDSADLSRISNEPLKVDDVVQKAFINVTTSGTEAAAATAVIAVAYSAKHFSTPTKEFTANHPFLYEIKYNDNILFAGRVSHKSDL